MSNRQARRDQMRTTRQQRAQQTRQSRPSRGSSGPSRGGGGSGLAKYMSSPFLIIVVVVVVALAAILGVIIATRSTDDGGATARLTAAETAFPYEQAKGTKVGSDDAPVKLTEYEDFQCPFCLHYTAEEEPALMADYVKAGKVQIEYRNYPLLGAESVRAAKAGVCAAEQDKFWQFHNKLFLVQAEAGQATNEKKNVGRFSDANLKQYAKNVGVDEVKYDACFASDATLKTVNDQLAEAKSFGITGTPGFLINGTPLGAGAPSTVEAWHQLIDDAIKQVENPSPTPTGSATANGNATPAATGSATTAASATATKAAASATTAAATATPTKAP
jgi:protein-disulfide isomerase